MRLYAVVEHSYREGVGRIERRLELRNVGFNHFGPLSARSRSSAFFNRRTRPSWVSAFAAAWCPQGPGRGRRGSSLPERPVGPRRLPPRLAPRTALCKPCSERGLVAYNGSAELPEGLRPIVMDHSGKWFAVRPHHQTHGPLFVPEMKGAMSEGIVMESVGTRRTTSGSLSRGRARRGTVCSRRRIP